MSDKRYKSRKQKIRHGGGGAGRRHNQPKTIIKVYKGDRKAA